MSQDMATDRAEIRSEEPVQDRHHDEHVEERETSRTVVDRRVWSPAQLVAGGVGLFLIVMGAVAVLRGGFESLTGPSVGVAGFEHTTLMGIVSMTMGALFLVAAASIFSVREMLTFLGFLSLGFGLIVAIEPGRVSEWLGGGSSLGVLYAAIGVVSLVAGWASPTIVQRRTALRKGHDRIESDSV